MTVSRVCLRVCVRNLYMWLISIVQAPTSATYQSVDHSGSLCPEHSSRTEHVNDSLGLDPLNTAADTTERPSASHAVTVNTFTCLFNCLTHKITKLADTLTATTTTTIAATTTIDKPRQYWQQSIVLKLSVNTIWQSYSYTESCLSGIILR